jgi:translation elongation factor EF-1alpha
MRTIALLGDDVTKTTNVLKVLLDKNSDLTDFNDKSKSIYNLNLKQDKYSIQAVNLDENDSESVKVYFNSDILIVYFTLIDNKTIDSRIKEHIFMANVFGITNVISILDTNLIDDTKTFVNIRNKITDSFVKRNFKKKDLTFLEYRVNNIALKELLYQALQPKKNKKEQKAKSQLLLSIDNVFRVDKNHIGINGKITSGELEKNTTVEILPINEKYKVLEIQARHVSINNAKEGEHIGLLIKSKNNFIDEGMVIVSKENDFKLVNEISIQIINVSKIGEAISTDNSYLFGSHNISKIGKINLITAQENNKKKNIGKILKGEKGIIHVKFREPVFLTTYNNSKKFGSIALLNSESKESIGLGIIKTVKYK